MSLLETIKELEDELARLKARIVGTAATIPQPKIGLIIDDIKRGDVIVCERDFTTFNGSRVAAGTRLIVEQKDDSTVPLKVRWEGRCTSKADWTRVTADGIYLTHTYKV